EQLADLRQGPVPPIVGEGALELRAVLETKVDVIDGSMRDRVERVLIPHVREPATNGALFQHGLLGFPAAVRVEHEDALTAEAPADAREVRAHLGARLEYPVAEAERREDVHALRHRLPHVAPEELDPLTRLADGCEVVLRSPGEHGPVDVDADRSPLRALLHPGGGEEGRAAEVFAQAHRGSTARRTEDPVDEVDLGLGILNRALVERVLVGRRGGEGRAARSSLRALLARCHGLPARTSTTGAGALSRGKTENELLRHRFEERARFPLAISARRASRDRGEGSARLVEAPETQQTERSVVPGLGGEPSAWVGGEVAIPGGERPPVVLLPEMRSMRLAVELVARIGLLFGARRDPARRLGQGRANRRRCFERRRWRFEK